MDGANSGKIDVHTHILPESWPDLREKYGYGGFIRLDRLDPCSANMMKDDTFFRRVDDRLWNPERRLEDCDSDGVAMQVLSTVPVMFSYWARPADCLDLSMLLNDHIADVVRQYPDRFAGLGTLPMQDADLAIKELERCVRELGLVGAEIGTHVNDWNLEAPEVGAVFEAAAELGAAIFVHPWDMMGMDRMPKYWLPWLVGMPAETSLAICSMIFGGVFEKNPELRVCFAHGGGAFPATVGRVAHGFDVRPDLCAVDNDVSPISYLGKFFVDSLVHDAAALEYLVSVVGEERVMVGSDYPFPLGETPAGGVVDEFARADDPRHGKMIRENATKFLGLKAGGG